MPDDATVVVELDRCERGAVLAALADERNQRIAEGKTTDALNEVIIKVAYAPSKKRRGRDEAR
ncbi:MAG: hypothetical protein LBJ48_00215 [Coriobacteriales bacterium]|jgi:hypothetical protein|nr:hypothetical protein [Coriobacteriales bacterium]